MKQIIAITILSILVNVLVIWDVINTRQVFNHIKRESDEIYETLLSTPIKDEVVSEKILDLKDYWTKKMDILVISISRKDLQPISDHLQFLDSAITNDDQESAVTYALLLKYNVEGLYEANGFTFLNVL